MTDKNSPDGPLVLLDVDGVINLAQFRSSKQRRTLLREGGWFHSSPSRDPFAGHRLLVNLRAVRPLVQELAGNGAELAWATTWMAEANWYIGPLLGLPELRYAPAPYGRKAVNVIAWTQGRPWAWLDDQEEELAMASALSKGRPHLPVLVDRATGLTQEHVDAVSEWLKSL